MVKISELSNGAGIGGTEQVPVNDSGTTVKYTVDQILARTHTHTASQVTDLQPLLDAKVDENSAITPATKTKITYDAKGLVTTGTDAGISDISGLQGALDAKASLAGATFTGDIVVPAETYGAGWNGSNEAPTKNDVYDKIETLTSGRTRVIKTSNTNRTSTTTLTDDPDLKFSMSANTKYSFRAVIFIRLYSAGDFKYRHTGPSSPTLVSIHRRSVVPAATTFSGQLVDESYSAADLTILLGASNGQGVILMEGIIHNGSNAGSFAFQWAQNTSDGNPTTVYAGSYIEYISY